VEAELADIDSVTVPDSLTAVFWFRTRSPNQFLNAAAQMLILPAHQMETLSPEALRDTPPLPIGTGRFRLKSWDHGSSLEIVSDTTNYRGRAKLDRVIWSVTPDFSADVAKLFRGEADVFDGLRLENVRELPRHRNVRAVILPATEYVFLVFNLRDPASAEKSHPLFGNRDLRRALTMSIDRDALVRSVFDTLAEVPLGPTVRAFQSTSPLIPQIPFDPGTGQSELDSLGWSNKNAQGIRIRDGRELGFTLLVSSLSVNRMRMAVLIQEQLRKAGIRVQIEHLDNAAQVSRLSTHNFDASIWSWRLGASLDGTRAGWTQAGLGKGGVNFGSYENPQFDAQLELALMSDPIQSRTAFTKAFAIINQDAPAVWLYEPKIILGLHRRIKTTRMRPDAWWFGLADWSVAPSERILRDRIVTSR
jgi:peptide/nickel transport system substrate-binding protein